MAVQSQVNEDFDTLWRHVTSPWLCWLTNNENFAVKNVVIFLDIVMKLSLVQIYLYIVDRFRKKGEEE